MNEQKASERKAEITGKIGTEPYKGVRDFYPDEYAVQKYIFDTMRLTVERYGYAEYSASILEPAALYRAKSGEEIVNEQMYIFEDRGGREVALRPEMTPTVARMVAAKRRELNFPIRWYSIPDLFRYERPQRGRLREHWQLNVDLFGLDNMDADAEVVTIADAILQKLGLKPENYIIRVSHSMLLRSLFSNAGIDETDSTKIIKTLDKFLKGAPKPSREVAEHVDAIIGEEQRKKIFDMLFSDEGRAGNEYYQTCIALQQKLNKRGVSVMVNPALTRGFDYYTGIVFEVFDMHPENNRSLFGGGRYDKLLDIFGAEPVPAVGFGMGDVTIRDVLQTYGLIPESVRNSRTQLALCPMNQTFGEPATALAEKLRDQGLRVAVDYTYKKVGDQIKKADKDTIPYVLCIGEEEVKNGQYRLKHLESGEEKTLGEGDLIEYLKTIVNY